MKAEEGLVRCNDERQPPISRRKRSAGLAEWRVARKVNWRAGRVVFAALTITRLVDEVWETMLVGKTRWRYLRRSLSS